MHALLAIKPEFAEKILNGEKEYEFRRKSFQDNDQLGLVFLYASSPVRQIVGVFTSDRVVEGPPAELWELFGDKSGITERERFMEYFEGVNTGFAIHVDETYRFSQSIDPGTIFDEYTPPISFKYIDEEEEEEAALLRYVPDDFHKDPVETNLRRYSSN